MMAAINALINNRSNIIMLYACPADIEREREALSKLFDQELAKIPRHKELVEALLTDRGETLAKAADLIAKAAPDELLKAKMHVAELKAEHGRFVDANWSYLAGLGQIAKTLATYNERSAELDRLAKRGDLRFCINAPPPPQPSRSGH